MAKKLKLIKGLSNSPLKKLNEGQVLKNPDKYVFEGVFTQCSTPEHKIINRNGRIYMENAVLAHLGYLRDMIKENNGRILGELDHPEGRLEVLDTPNGKILKSLVEAGYPLYVSSRAAGDVDPKTKEVEIAQIFTYDVVCTPGFKEARLERVNESLLTDGALKYINESVGGDKKIKVKEVEVPMEAINENVSKFNNTKMADVVKPLNEDDEATESKEKSLNDDVKKFLPIMNMVTQPAPANSTEKKEELKEEDGEDEASEENKDKENLENSDESSDNDENQEEVGDDEEKKELTDEEKEANREKIISVKGMDADGNVLGDEAESDEEDKSDDIENIEAETKDSEEENKDEKSEEENSEDEDETSENAEVNKEAKKAEEKTSELKKKTDEDVAGLESILASVEKKEAVKESIVRRYPFASVMTESNFAKFASLRPKQKKRVADFLDEYQIHDIESINELWLTPFKEEKKIQQNWLRLASQSDIDLYVAAPMEVQNAIEEQAKYFPMETEADVDAFWDATGLRQQEMRRQLNEKMVNDYNSFVSNVDESFEANLGYDPYLIRQTELWLQNEDF